MKDRSTHIKNIKQRIEAIVNKSVASDAQSLIEVEYKPHCVNGGIGKIRVYADGQHYMFHNIYAGFTYDLPDTLSELIKLVILTNKDNSEECINIDVVKVLTAEVFYFYTEMVDNDIVPYVIEDLMPAIGANHSGLMKAWHKIITVGNNAQSYNRWWDEHLTKGPDVSLPGELGFFAHANKFILNHISNAFYRCDYDKDAERDLVSHPPISLTASPVLGLEDELKSLFA